MLDNLNSSQLSYLYLLLDKSDPEEEWDTAMTNYQFCEVLDNFEQQHKEINTLWCNDFTAKELLSVPMESSKSKVDKEQCAHFDVGYNLDTSDEDNSPDIVLVAKMLAPPIPQYSKIVSSL